MPDEKTKKSEAKAVPFWQRPRTYTALMVAALAAAMFVSAVSIITGHFRGMMIVAWLIAIVFSIRMPLFTRYYRAMELLRAGKLAESAAMLEGAMRSRFIGSYFRWCCYIHLSLIRFAQLDYSRVAELSWLSLHYTRRRPMLRKNSLVNLHAAMVRLGKKADAESLSPKIEPLPPHPLLDFVFACNVAYGLILEGRHEDALAKIEPFAGKLAAIHETSASLFNAEMAYLLNALGRKAEAEPYLREIQETPQERLALCFKQNPTLSSIFNK
jgi:hypothetical protein